MIQKIDWEKDTQHKIEHIWENQWGTTDEGYISEQTMELLLSVIRTLLLSSQSAYDEEIIKGLEGLKCTKKSFNGNSILQLGYDVALSDAIYLIRGKT